MTTPEELRNLVAEKVMGRERKGPAGAWYDPNQKSQLMPYRHVWDPLESWADAGRVLDAMLARGWQVNTLTTPAGLTSCYVIDGETSAPLGYVEAEGLKLAWCLAALEALGVEVEVP